MKLLCGHEPGLTCKLLCRLRRVNRSPVWCRQALARPLAWVMMDHPLF